MNAVLPGGATLTGMIPESFPTVERDRPHNPDIVIPVVAWLASGSSGGATGKRFDASKWRLDLSSDEAAKLCAREAGVYAAGSEMHAVEARSSLPRMTYMIGGAPFRLKPGEWTDDTSMALCLANSLIRMERISTL